MFGLLDFENQIEMNKSINPPVKEIVHAPQNDEIMDFNLKIEKINLDVPIIPNVDGRDKNIYNQALDNGVAHYKNTALPNSGSNIVIFGHSSTILGIGKYSRIFSRLNDLVIGEEIILSLNSKEYRYSIREKKIISASDSSVLIATDREQLTLITCWPVGTAQKRLVVIANPQP